MTVLVDSWAWIEYWSGAPHADQAGSYIEGEEEAIVSTINLAEIYHWVLLHYDEKTAEEKVITVRRRCFIIPVEEEIAVEAAKINHKTKKSLADSIIIATANQVKAKILTGDPDFKKLRDIIYIGD
mgnify:CR=1 FL=1